MTRVAVGHVGCVAVPILRNFFGIEEPTENNELVHGIEDLMSDLDSQSGWSSGDLLEVRA